MRNDVCLSGSDFRINPKSSSFKASGDGPGEEGWEVQAAFAVQGKDVLMIVKLGRWKVACCGLWKNKNRFCALPEIGRKQPLCRG